MFSLFKEAGENKIQPNKTRPNKIRLFFEGTACVFSIFFRGVFPRGAAGLLPAAAGAGGLRGGAGAAGGALRGGDVGPPHLRADVPEARRLLVDDGDDSCGVWVGWGVGVGVGGGQEKEKGRGWN